MVSLNPVNGLLGRKAIKTDTRTLRLASYLSPESSPPPPAACDWTRGREQWGMMLNDTLSDCTIAGAAHAVEVWSQSRNPDAMQTVSDGDVLKAYEQWNGYDPAKPETDSGGIALDVLTTWRKQDLAGHGLLAFAATYPLRLREVRTAITQFGGVYIGVSLPESARDQTKWEVERGDQDEPGSWGGHCVFVPKYDRWSFTCITWGGMKSMSVRFWKEYVDEVYSLFGEDWVNPGGEAPSGFNVAQLNADLSLIR